MLDLDNRDPFAFVRRMAAEAETRIARQYEEEAETPKQMFLPGLEEHMRAMPNHIARSSLFAPVARGRKKMHDGTILVSRVDACLEYWGPQLNELHADVTMQLLCEQQRQGVPVGQAVYINRNAFLCSLGWGNSGQEYKRFHRYMKELTGAMLVIESRKQDRTKKYHIGATKTFRILENFECDEDGENYRYTLDPRWVVLFGNREYALIDWKKRLQIGAGQDLAKSLQRLIATSSDTLQRYELNFLKERAQYGGRMRDFKASLAAAMRELERLEIIARGHIECSSKNKEQAVWTRL